MKVIHILLFILLTPLLLKAQEEVDGYESEFIYGINKNTAGGLIGGIVLRKSRKIGDRLYQSYGLELMNVKHPLEYQLRASSGSTFIFGKVNYLYAFRFQYGRELILFRKAPQQGVEIKLLTAIGPTIGLLAPYYIEFNPDGGGSIGNNNTKREPYNPNNPNHDNSKIVGTGYILQGINESKIRLGANVKAGLSFELGTSKSSVTGFEIGALLEAYTQKIELLAGAENKSFFPTAYITIFYGTRR
ncbi:MAG TPA: hypothetical protein PKL31_10595 [Fulvivirga sp.]|nr:hypothetical protein [Fulvivirga sp.]